MEDTIIFSLIERSQYALNSPVYQPGATVQQYLKDSGRQLSLLEYLLMETVRVIFLPVEVIFRCQLADRAIACSVRRLRVLTFESLYT